MLANSKLPLYLQLSIAFVHPLVALVGITGNLLIVAIVPRAAVRVSRSAKLYYSIIAIADLLELLVGNVLWSFLDDGLLLLTGNRFSLRIVRYSDATCKLFYLLCELTGNLSNYTIVALAIECCLIVFFPLRAKRFVRLRFSVMLIAIIVAPVWLCSFITVPFIVKLRINMTHYSQSGQECEKDETPLTETFTVALTLLSYSLHTILTIILVTLISIKLAHIRYQRKAMIRDKRVHSIAAHESNTISNQQRNNFVLCSRIERQQVSSPNSCNHNTPSETSTTQIEQRNKIELLRHSSESANPPKSSTRLCFSFQRSHSSKGARSSCRSPYNSFNSFQHLKIVDMTTCEQNSPKSPLPRSLPQLPEAAVTQSTSWDQSESKRRHEKLTASDPLEVPALHSSFSGRCRKYHSRRRGGNDAGDVRTISRTYIRAFGRGSSHGNGESAFRNVGIGATVVMVLLATINVIIYLPAAAVELVCLIVENEVLESLSRFLFDNLCFAHSFNIFVYVIRIPSFKKELMRLFGLPQHSERLQLIYNVTPPATTLSTAASAGTIQSERDHEHSFEDCEL